MANLGKAVIEFSADTAKFVGDIGRAAAVFNKNMAAMERGVANLRNAAIGLAGVSGFGVVIKSAISAGDEMNKLSQKVGIAVEQLSGLKFAAELADVGVDDLTRGLKEFSKTLAEAGDPGSKSAGLFSALGITPSNDPRQALKQVADAFQQLPDGMQKATLAGELFGKNGLSFIPLLNQGGAAIDRTTESARRMGLVMSAEFARQAEQFNDNMKVLEKQSSVLGIALTGKVIEGLVSITGNLVQAVEQGRAFAGVLKEIARMSAALTKTYIPSLGGLTDYMVERTGLFHERRVITGPDTRPVMGPPTPNPDQLACVLSGGKWVNGACVRTGGGKAGRGDDNLVGRQLAEDMAEWDKIMAEASQLTDDFYRKQREGEAELDATRMKAWLEFIDREAEREEIAMRMAAGFDEAGKKIEDAKRKSADFGFTFNSALEKAIINGEKLIDVLKSFARDAAQMVLRKTVTEPLGNMISSGIGSLFGGLMQKGVPAYAEGTDYVPRTGLAMVHQGEAIIPAGENRGGVTLNMPINFSANTPAAVRDAVQSMIPGITQAAMAGMREANRRGRG